MNNKRAYTVTIILAILIIIFRNFPLEIPSKSSNLKLVNFEKIQIKNNNITEINTKDNIIGKKIIPNNIIDTSFTIQLETNSNNLIGNIDELIIYNKEIFILDIHISKSIYVFDLNGRFLRKIGENGLGKGEYLRPESFDIDKTNNEVLIFFSGKAKILRYTIDGAYLGEINTGIKSHSFKLTDKDNFFLLSAGFENKHLGELSNKQYYIIDKFANIISYGLERNNDFSQIKFNIENNFISKNEDITFSYRFSDTIFKLEKNFLSAIYKIDLNNKSFRNSIKNKNTEQFLRIIRNSKSQNSYFMGKHFKTSNYLYLSYNLNNSIIHCFFNRQNSKLVSGNIIFNEDSKYPLFTNFCGNYNDYFVSSKDAYTLLKLKNTKHDLYKSLKLKRIKKTDNPILFFYKFKF